MEVHHHPHVEKKSFKEYLLEGLMIFLAVTMGFIAENIREYIKEHQIAKEYAVTMVKDLSADTADLKGYLQYYRYGTSNIDTLFQLVSSIDLKDIPSGKLYWYGLWGGLNRTFIPNDATITQLKNSGSLRFFSNSGINSKVAYYDQMCRTMTTSELTDKGVYIEVRKARAKIFEFKFNNIANNISRANQIKFQQSVIDSFIQINPPLLSYDKTTFNEYLEIVRSRRLTDRIKMADTLLAHATELIALLQKEYHLENE